MQKKCRRCGEIKLITEFYKNSNTADGYLNQCKICTLKAQKKYYRENKEKHHKYRVEYYERNKDRAIKQNKEYIKNNREKVNKWGRDCYKRHSDKYLCRNKSHRAVKSGKLEKQPCAICNDVDSEIHHEDYTKPLEVMWICRPCHFQYHKFQKIIKGESNGTTDSKEVIRPDSANDLGRGV